MGESERVGVNWREHIFGSFQTYMYGRVHVCVNRCVRVRVYVCNLMKSSYENYSFGHNHYKTLFEARNPKKKFHTLTRTLTRTRTHARTHTHTLYLSFSYL